MDGPTEQQHESPNSFLSDNKNEPFGYCSDTEMNKRPSRFLYDAVHDAKNNSSVLSRLAKGSVVSIRRSLNLKFIILLAASSTFVVCFYSGVFSELFPVPNNPIVKDNAKGGASVRLDGSKETADGSMSSEEYAKKGERRYPSVIIFGVSKCGTRAVLEYLKLHPNVVAPMAEINFFNNETLFKRGLKWYIRQMPYAHSNELVVEKSPDYFQNPECAPMIRLMNSDVKLLLLLRDPVERLVSQYMQLIEKNPSLPRFEEWVLDQDQDPPEVNEDVRSVLVSAYSKYLETWLSIFPRDQILIVESNDLRNEPYNEMKRVESFLNLKPFFEPSDFYFNSTRGFYCLRHRSNEKIKCLGKSKGRQHIPIDEDVSKILHSYYAPYNKRLNELIGKKFQWS